MTTPKADELDAEPLQQFFPERHYVPLLQVLATINRYSDFLNELQHWRQRYHHGRPPERAFYASIMRLGAGIDLRKRARISTQINEAELEYTVNWYFSVENTHAANDRVLHLIDRLELPNVYRYTPERVHTASNGQKFEVRLESLNANPPSNTSAKAKESAPIPAAMSAICCITRRCSAPSSARALM